MNNDPFGWFLIGFFTAIVLIVFFVYSATKKDEEEKKKQRLEELEEFYKNHQSEVVDAHFVEIQKLSLPQPSQALVPRRTDLTRR